MILSQLLAQPYTAGKLSFALRKPISKHNTVEHSRVPRISNTNVETENIVNNL